MFEEYKKSLLDFYWVKHKNNRLSINLEDPGREKIRNECAKVFLRKNTQQDRDFIRLVFDPTHQSSDLVRSIEKFDLNKLRPLVSFLTIKDRNIRDEKLVKLLAWLIDFPSYSEWRELSDEELKFIFEEAVKKHEDEQIEVEEDREENQSDDEKLEEDTNDDNELKGEKDREEDQNDDKENEGYNTEPIYIRRFSIRHITVASIILFFICNTSFVAWENSQTTIRMPNADEKFMYWDGDHYEPIADEKQDVGAAIIPLNIQTLTQQRKINLPDTLTSYSIGKVWYKGHGKDHEFFTDSGAYPLDLQRVLKPLTSFILTKYTSNYRYMLTRLSWFLCAAFFIGLCGYGVSKLEKEIKEVDELKEENNQEENVVSETANEVSGAELEPA